jgi:FMN phosphatase YigB (HAD superfamily)
MLARPDALLLDFGGVLAEAPPQRIVPPELVLRVFNLTHKALTPGEIQRSLTEGAAAYARWRDEDHPDEMPPAQVWERFLMPHWPATAQARVRVAIAKLSYDWAWHHDWELRPGILDLLHAASDAGLPLGVVSNTLSGAAHRDFLAKAGVGPLFAVQVYSEEVGVRKPNPQMIWHATDELGVTPRSCWYVGDTRRRDVVCARRADAGTAVLMRSRRTEEPGRWPEPDAVVRDGHELLALLRDVL